MNKILIFTVAFLISIFNIIVCANTFELKKLFYFVPIQMNDKQVLFDKTIQETKEKIQVNVYFVDKEPQIKATDPNSGGKVSIYFNPFSYQGVIESILFKIHIKNDNNKPIEIRGEKYQLNLEKEPYTINSINFIDLAKLWRGYYYYNTYTITGSPNVFEQEKAIEAENYIIKTTLKSTTLYPGRSIEGFIVFPSNSLNQSKLILNINDIYLDQELVNFKFMFVGKENI